jgi:hypothetical protein
MMSPQGTQTVTYVDIDDKEITAVYTKNNDVPEDQEGRWVVTVDKEVMEQFLHALGYRNINPES